jgi:hypothetical protein
VTKKASRSKDEVVDVRADDPEHAMEHFNDGLRRVLAAPKVVRRTRVRRQRKAKR